MRPRLIAIGLVLAACSHPHAQRKLEPQASSQSPAREAQDQAAPTAPTTPGVEFKRDVQPIMQSRCQPCHFPGGKMYDRPHLRLAERLLARAKALGITLQG